MLICIWPKGGRPAYPFVYSHEVWPGIEYHVAANLIYEGYLEEGLAIVKALRDRHGVRRSPWNEVECGRHCSRSMASWGLILALSSFSYDLVGSIDFEPRISTDVFSCFWSTGTAWGTVKITEENGKIRKSIEVLHGKLG